MSADKYDSIAFTSAPMPTPTRPRPGGLMSEPPKSASAKASGIGLPSLCKFNDLLCDHRRSLVSAATQMRTVARHPVRRAHGLNDLGRKIPTC
jgi:hypothetical protein